MNVRVYLAGPEVFLSNAREIGALKRGILRTAWASPASSLLTEEDAFDPAPVAS